MPSGKKVTPLFGALLNSISCYFIFCCFCFAANENNALAAHNVKGKAPARAGVPPGRAIPYIVVLDPGHGGSDRGASGRLGKTKIAEKELSLAIALKTAKILTDPDYYRPLGRPIKVILTRKTDRYVSLEARSARGRNAKADLFVSIHANSETTRTVRGLEIYFLNNTDEESSLKLQQIENRTSKRKKGKTDDSLLIRSVAADAVVESSRTAAEILHSSLVDQLRSEDLEFKDRGVRQAMLYVLLDAQVPAVLVESFYLSSKTDLALVTDAENRGKIAEGIAKGVLRFLAQK